MTVGSLFSGIGGLDLGFERAGFTVRWMCEKEDYCRRVLARHFPNLPIYDDVSRVATTRATTPERVRVIVGGFPCQDISLAGSGAGLDGSRSGLWWEMYRVIGILRPEYVVLENVPALVHRGLPAVLGALSALGYDAEWEIVSAAALGAPHLRERIFVVAYADRCRQPRDTEDALRRDEVRPRAVRQSHTDRCSIRPSLADTRRSRREEPDVAGVSVGARHYTRCGSEALHGRAVGTSPEWAGHRGLQPQPIVRALADGFPEPVAAIRAGGNAVVPQVAEYVARCVRRHAEETGVWYDARGGLAA